jgi:endo-1,4-beta-xylanase
MQCKTSVLLLWGVIATGCGSSTPTGPAAMPAAPPSPPAAGARLRQAAETRGILIGSAITTRQIAEAEYASTAGAQFNMIEAEYEMKFRTVLPSENRYDFTPGDAIVAFGESRGMKVRGHTLLWHQSVPTWLETKSPAQLGAILESYIRTVAGRYRGRVFAWDVANEIFNDDGTTRSSLWYDKPGTGTAGAGPSYIESAFRWAGEADPAALLFYNDYNAEAVNTKSTAIYNMVKGFKARGVPIDGVGLQMHRTLSPLDLASFEANLRRLGDLGLQVHITEMDVRVPIAANGAASEADLQSQARIYEGIVSTCLKVPACTAIQFWGVTDKYSWILTSFPGFGAPLLFDANYQAKAAFWSVYNSLGATR